MRTTLAIVMPIALAVFSLDASAAAPAATTTDDAALAANLETVTVTATKRTERLQDVPASIGVISAADIERRGLVNSEDYLRGTPGVNQTGDYGGQSIVIRGLETSPAGQNGLSGTTVATYFGEAPTTNSAGLAGNTAIDIKLVDIERVEVLRGPQGTAFGSSSLGGVVRTIPAAPELDQLTGRVGTSYSRTQREGGSNYMVQGVLNVPLITEKVAMRAVAYRFEDAGYYRNIAGSDPETQAAAAAFGAQQYAVDQGNIGDSEVTGARLATLVQVNDALRLTLNYLQQKTQTDGTAVADRPGYTQNFLQASPQTVRHGSTAGFSDTEIKLFSAVLEQDLNWGNLLATYNYGRSSTTQARSYSVFPAFYPSWPFSHAETGPHREQSGEIRLVTELEGPLNALVGVYAERQEDDDHMVFSWYGDPAANPYNPGQTSIATFTQYRTLDQIAGFGELSWKILPNLTLTGGVRAYDYDRDAHFHNEGVLTPNGLQIIDRTAQASGTTVRGNLSYKPTEEALLYTSYAEGFRLGSPRNGVSEILCDVDSDGVVDGTDVTIASTQETKSDTVDSYEVGGKAMLFDRRLQLDAAVYRIDWTGLPVYSLLTSCSQNYLVNAGRARSEGFELQLSAFLTRALRVDAGVSKVDARFTEPVPSLGADAGTQLAGSPDFNANLGVEYGFDLAGRPASVRADAIYVGSFYGDPAKSPSTRAGDYVKIDLSARTTLGRLNLDVFARNLLNADDYSFRFIYAGMGDFFGYRLRPRTIGVQLSYDF